MTPNILVVDDDADLREFLRDYLSKQGFLVRTVDSGTAALDMVEKTVPDLIILDLNLPTITGDVVCKEVKESNPEIQVIMLTAKDTTPDVVHGLSLGADDYIKKPFDIDELLIRIKTRLKQKRLDYESLSIADLEFNPRTMVVKRANKTINLTPQEIKILEYLLANKGNVLSREMILSRLWKTNPDIETRVVDVYIGYLRKKIDAPFKQKLIHSVRGFGYKISTEQ
jgi:DNA-binding response OmpR family regulator